MKNIKIVYEYDGSKFSGFQRQTARKTVQGSIEEVIKNYFDEEINLLSSGRTDRGVHALGQVSNFYMKKDISPDIIKKILNRSLAGEIRVICAEEAEPDFHARFSAKTRIYLYIMKLKDEITPFESNYVSALEKKTDPEKLQKIMKPFIGRHNFDSFRKKDKDNKNPEREINNIRCYEKDSRLFIEIEGKAFLKTMVRIMIGSAVAVYSGKKECGYIQDKLDNPDSDGEKILAPSEGLYLYKVNY